jgi:hypothetical protein
MNIEGDIMISLVGWVIFHSVITLAWLISINEWMKRGCRAPAWLHIFAGSMFFAGLVVMTVLNLMNMLTLNLAMACLFAPPAAAYFGWLWMFGPEFGGAKS